MNYPAQLKPPLEPQLPLDALDAPDEEAPKEAMVDIFFWVSKLAHFGQVGVRSISEKRTIFSKVSPQVLQRYSYKGIEVTSRDIYYTPV
jgi:hypothetical protein